MTDPHGHDGSARVNGPETERPAIDTQGLAPAMPLDDASVVRDEQFIDAHDEVKLFLQTWLPAGGPPNRGIIAVMHGYGEHSSRYDHVAGAMVRAGYGVVAIDARGHGRSTGKRAHVESFDDYVRDFDAMLAFADEKWPELPVFGLGHSLGGLIVLHHAMAPPRSIAGYVTTSPFLDFAFDVAPTKAAFGHMMSRLWPSFSLPNDVDPSLLSHDERVIDKYRRDPLIVRTATGRWFTETRGAQKKLRDHADQIQAPCLFLVAGADELADPDATEEIFHRMSGGSREMDVYPQLRHELLNEPNWGQIVGRIADWLAGRTESKTTEEAA
jgi:lysophospholipase